MANLSDAHRAKNEQCILAVVKFNKKEALVLNTKIQLKYNRHGDTIVGTDGVFYSCLFRMVDRHAKAFAGRRFDLTMEDGEIVHCDGQWWDGITDKAASIIGDEIVHITASDIESLSNCYVFTGFCASKRAYQKFRSTYTGDVMEYYDFKLRFIEKAQKKYVDLCSHQRKRIWNFKKLIKLLKRKHQRELQTVKGGQ